jgi:hypothetical protein
MLTVLAASPSRRQVGNLSGKAQVVARSGAECSHPREFAKAAFEKRVKKPSRTKHPYPNIGSGIASPLLFFGRAPKSFATGFCSCTALLGSVPVRLAQKSCPENLAPQNLLCRAPRQTWPSCLPHSSTDNIDVSQWST